MLNKDQLEHFTRQVISRAFHQHLRDDDPSLEKTLRHLIDDLLPPGSDIEDRDKLLKRVWAAVNHQPADPVVAVVHEICQCEPGDAKCLEACPVGALAKDTHDRCTLDPDRCVECGLCVDVCHSGSLVERSECLRLVDMVQEREKRPVYAILAPAFVGQFGPKATDGQVKSSFKQLGFSDVFEVALAADVITLREADEYIDRMEHGKSFMITSCCCPAFMKLIEKHEPLATHLVSDSVSPMIALGRMLKAKEPDARVVFIGPCLAKRAEAKLDDMRGAIDGVLTLKEAISLMEAAGISPEDQASDDHLEDASHDGRIYAHTGGVTEAIIRAIHQKRPEMSIRSTKGNGLKQCREILQAVERGEETANFMEGMACPGGCLGGPGTVIKVAEAVPFMHQYSRAARALSARENEKALHYLETYAPQVNFHTQHLQMDPAGVK